MSYFRTRFTVKPKETAFGTAEAARQRLLRIKDLYGISIVVTELPDGLLQVVTRTAIPSTAERDRPFCRGVLSDHGVIVEEVYEWLRWHRQRVVWEPVES